ncbi:putative mediator of RNA polymerase II transcription subunit 37c [Tanacetum coccineum]
MSKRAKVPAIGIDLGTTYSCMSVWRHNRVEIIANDQGNRITPSCVSFNNTERLVGDAAKHDAAYNPTNTIFDVKRLIGRRASDETVQEDMKSWPFKVVAGNDDKPKIVVSYKGEKIEFTAEEISSMVLAKMKDAAEMFLGSSIEKAVITVPAYFYDSQRQSTKDAANVAGLEVMQIINEPTAAAIAYALDKRSSIRGKMNVLVFDLGGGTFDVSILTIDESGVIKVKATGGDTHLGGEDFDTRMMNYFVREFKRKHKEDISMNQKALGKLRVHCERAKRIISSYLETNINIESLVNGIDFSGKFIRARFEEVNMDLFKKWIETVRSCLKDVNMSKDNIDDVVTVGGSTRIPKVQQMLKDFFNGKLLCQGINPDEAVASGAGILAANLSGMGDKVLEDLVLIDVTPLSLGVACVGDVMAVLIPRNSPIPIKKEHMSYTTIDYQTRASFHVYQGERSNSNENYYLGELELDGIPSALKREVEIKYLSTKEIDNMIKDAERYKLEDELLVKKANARNVLESYACKRRAIVKDYKGRLKLRKMGVSVKCLKDVERQIDEAIEWLEDNPNAEIDEMENKEQELNDICRLNKLNTLLKD